MKTKSNSKIQGGKFKSKHNLTELKTLENSSAQSTTPQEKLRKANQKEHLFSDKMILDFLKEVQLTLYIKLQIE